MKPIETLTNMKGLRSIRYFIGVLASLAVVLVLFLGASWAGQTQEKKEMHGHGEMKHGEMGMHPTEGMHRGNPEEGKPIYQRLCASCHGASGRGDGPVGQVLNPKPSDFTKHVGYHGDGYFFKVIKEGGPAAGKSVAMPAWGAQLKEEEIWNVIAYLRTFTKHH
jgi:mono/diheme cytochrome c family protein